MANENLIEWWGHREDICDIYIKKVTLYVYHHIEKGYQNLLLRQLHGRAIITSDVPGCREIVIDGFNGILVPKKIQIHLPMLF